MGFDPGDLDDDADCWESCKLLVLRDSQSASQPAASGSGSSRTSVRSSVDIDLDDEDERFINEGFINEDNDKVIEIDQDQEEEEDAFSPSR